MKKTLTLLSLGLLLSVGAAQAAFEVNTPVLKRTKVYNKTGRIVYVDWAAKGSGHQMVRNVLGAFVTDKYASIEPGKSDTMTHTGDLLKVKVATCNCTSDSKQPTFEEYKYPTQWSDEYLRVDITEDENGNIAVGESIDADKAPGEEGSRSTAGTATRN